MLEKYGLILFFIVLSFLFSIVFLAFAFIVSPKKPSREKLSPYECGFEALEDARLHFDVRFYLVAILFLVFDLEIAFLFPWVIVFDDVGLFGLLAMFAFLAILTVGFVFEWKKGALEWGDADDLRPRLAGGEV